MIKPDRFFSIEDDLSRQLLDGVENVWDVVAQLPARLSRLLCGTHVIDGEVMDGAVLGSAPIQVAAGARIEPGAYVCGPAYIGPGAVVRHGAYLRENCVLLAGAVVGHASEMKNSLLLPHARAPHFAYVGDSILGNRVNLGAGTKLGNTRLSGDRSINITVDGAVHDTGLVKLGAIIGDDCQLGCNVVTNPGTLLGPRTVVYPGTSVRGYYPADMTLKLRQEIVVDHAEAGTGPPR